MQSLIFGAAGLFILIVSTTATAVWTVSNVRHATIATVGDVKTATAVLGERMDQLRIAIDRLYQKHDGIAAIVASLEREIGSNTARISELEKDIAVIADKKRV